VAGGNVNVILDQTQSVVGYTYQPALIARLKGTDGSLDTSFGSGGVQAIDFGSDHEALGPIAVQGDGKIVAPGLLDAGRSDVRRSVFAVVRLTADGDLDASFGSGGVAHIDFGLTADQPNAVLIQADGNIVVAGLSEQPTTNYDFALVRLLG